MLVVPKYLPYLLLVSNYLIVHIHTSSSPTVSCKDAMQPGQLSLWLKTAVAIGGASLRSHDRLQDTVAVPNIPGSRLPHCRDMVMDCTITELHVELPISHCWYGLSTCSTVLSSPVVRSKLQIKTEPRARSCAFSSSSATRNFHNNESLEIPHMRNLE